MRKYLIISILIYISFFFACTSSNTSEKINCWQELNIHNVTIKNYKKSNYDYNIDLSYFVFNDTVQNIVNKDINDSITAILKKEISKFKLNCLKICQRDFENLNRNNSLSGDCILMENNDSLFSCRFRFFIEWNTYSTPSIYYRTFNFDRLNKKSITFKSYISDKQQDSIKILQSISQICASQLKNPNELGCNAFWDNTLTTNLLINFNIVNNGFIFIFDNYTLDSEYCGNPQIFIKFNDL